MPTLLEKAKQLKTESRFAPMKDEELELAIAWMKSELRNEQIKEVLGLPPTGTQIYAFLARALRAAYQQGKIKIV